jgi:transcriptional regulator with XRE-family HTH domain
MTKEEFRKWRERFGLSQGDVAARFSLSRNTIQNWESGASPLPSTIEGACTAWEDRLKKEMADIGPLTLIYADGPMFVDPYGPRRMAILQQEAFPTNAAALARVQLLWGRANFDGPFIIEKSGQPLWNRVELVRVVDGSDKGAPTLANTIRKVADCVRANSKFHARSGPKMATTNEMERTKAMIEAVANEMDALAERVPEGGVGYPDFDALLSRLHDLGFYPTNKLVSDVAHAAHGVELAAAAQYNV